MPFHLRNLPTGRNFTYLEDPGINEIKVYGIHMDGRTIIHENIYTYIFSFFKICIYIYLHLYRYASYDTVPPLTNSFSQVVVVPIWNAPGRAMMPLCHLAICATWALREVASFFFENFVHRRFNM